MEDYDTVGTKSPNWNDDAREALSLLASLRAHEEAEDKTPQLVSRLDRLHESNCTDPFIQYLYLRYIYGMPSTPEAGKLYADVADKMMSRRLRLGAQLLCRLARRRGP